MAVGSDQAMETNAHTRPVRRHTGRLARTANRFPPARPSPATLPGLAVCSERAAHRRRGNQEEELPDAADWP
jgi:hypothetical protein